MKSRRDEDDSLSLDTTGAAEEVGAILSIGDLEVVLSVADLDVVLSMADVDIVSSMADVNVII